MLKRLDKDVKLMNQIGISLNGCLAMSYFLDSLSLEHRSRKQELSNADMAGSLLPAEPKYVHPCTQCC